MGLALSITKQTPLLNAVVAIHEKHRLLITITIYGSRKNTDSLLWSYLYFYILIVYNNYPLRIAYIVNMDVKGAKKPV